MNEQELRLECVKLVLNVAPEPFEKVVERASFLEEFVAARSPQQPCSTGDKE